MRHIRKNKTLIISQIILIIAMGFIAYGNSLFGKFLWDDYGLVRDNLYIKHLSSISKIFVSDIGSGAGDKSNFYRPLQILTYAVDYFFWKLNAFGYHFTNILFHLATSLLIYWLLNLLSGNYWFSFLAGMFFTVHPIHTEAVAYISGRADVLATFFLLLTFIFYIKYIKSGRSIFYVICLWFYLFGLLSKEYSLITPAIILFYHYIFKIKIKIRDLLLLLSAVLIYFLLRLTLLKSYAYVAPMTYLPLIQRLAGFFVAIGEYLKLLFLPLNLHMEYGVGPFRPSQPRVLLGAAILLMALIYALRKRNIAILSFATGWFFIALLPVSSIFPINAYMAEHWLYLPSFGFFAVIAYGLITLHKKETFKIISVIFSVAAICFYTFLTIRQNYYWCNPVIFLKRTLKYAPGSPRICSELANEYAAAGNVEAAEELYKKAIKISADYESAYIGLGNLYSKIGKDAEALEIYQEAVKIAPNSPKPYVGLGNALVKLSREAEAIKFYQRALEIEPRLAYIYYNSGIVYTRLGQQEKAIEMFEKAIDSQPDYLPAYCKLSRIYNDMGKSSDLLRLYKEAIANNLEYFDAYYYIAGLSYNSGNYMETIELFKKAIKIEPGTKEAYFQLGMTYLSLGKNRQAIREFDRVIRIDPNFAAAYSFISIAYVSQKKYSLAITYCDKATKLGYKASPQLLELLKPYRK